MCMCLTLCFTDLAIESCHGIKRRPGENVGSFLRTQCAQCNVPSDLVDKFILMYNHARYGHAVSRVTDYVSVHIQNGDPTEYIVLLLIILLAVFKVITKCTGKHYF